MDKDITDSELLMLIKENNEDAESILYNRYIKYIETILNKYKLAINTIKLDYNDVYLECIKKYYEAIDSFNDNMDVTFKYFVKFLVSRKIKELIYQQNMDKYTINKNAISLNSVFDNNYPLKELFSLEEKLDPSYEYLEKDKIEELKEIFRLILSKFEYKVVSLFLLGYTQEQIAEYFNYDIKKIYNTTFRIKSKIKNFFDENT